MLTSHHGDKRRDFFSWDLRAELQLLFKTIFKHSSHAFSKGYDTKRESANKKANMAKLAYNSDGIKIIFHDTLSHIFSYALLT